MKPSKPKPDLSSIPSAFGGNDIRDVCALSDDQQSALDLVKVTIAYSHFVERFKQGNLMKFTSENIQKSHTW